MLSMRIHNRPPTTQLTSTTHVIFLQRILVFVVFRLSIFNKRTYETFSRVIL